MRLEAHRLRARHDVIVVVQKAPPSLDHREVGDHRDAVGLVEVRDDALEVVGERDAVGVEDGDEIRRRLLAASLEGARLEPATVGAADDVAHEAALAPPRGRGVHDRAAPLVVAVVQNLNLQEIARPTQEARGIDDATRHLRLVVHRKLDAHVRELQRECATNGRRRVAGVLLVLRTRGADEPRAVVVRVVVVVVDRRIVRRS